MLNEVKHLTRRLTGYFILRSGTEHNSNADKKLGIDLKFI